MSIPSLEFLVVILLLSALSSWCSSIHVRRGLLALLSFGFVVSLLPNASTAIALGVFLLSGYLVARWLTRVPNATVFGAYVTLLIGAFMVLRKYEVLEYVLPRSLFQHPIAIVGLSYILFRQIHFVVDSMQGQIKQSSLWGYLNYQLSLFTLLAGPMPRYQQFEASWNELRPGFQDRHELMRAYLRLLWGVVLMSLVAPACFELYDSALAAGDWGRPARAAAIFYAYPAYVYLNFSGYCSVVIAAASLLGLAVPENFDRPYVARNMIEFWNRWHITLSHWLRDYLFTPTYKFLAQRWPERALSMAPACYFFVFLIAGVWHGTTTNFVVFGLLHGAGLSVAKMWENRLIRRGGRKGLRQYLASRKIGACSVVLTLHFVCVTLLFLPADLPRCLEIIKSMFDGVPV